MTVLLKPCGRGRWHVLTMRIEGVHLAPFTVAVGAVWVLGGVNFRVAEVRP